MTSPTSFSSLFRTNFLSQQPIKKELSNSELTLVEGESIRYHGNTVVAYLGKRTEADIDSKRFPAVHLTYCKYIKENPTRFYCVSFDKSHTGKFHIEVVDKERVVVKDKTKEYKLSACQFCLEKLYQIPFNKNHYHSTGMTNRDKLAELSNNFDFNDFIESDYLLNPRFWYDTELGDRGDGCWKSLSKRVREEANWVCDECHECFKEEGMQHHLHVHHINNNSMVNHRLNLRPLCIGCHAEQPNHQHMKINNSYYQDYINMRFAKNNGRNS